eukprot:TRINITY_DN5403_c0_g1_i1.p1 TRINITY_DN5403_c0_g1~~TRINITY_DN5403_c0_g1_i1.p1  ORF type:complete len:215 (+),score=45.34 TRINITY_DN5403_c0_g1_i1:189-833(+)
MRDPLRVLADTRQEVDRKERVLRQKLAAEIEKTKEFLSQKNNHGAKQCRKLEKIYQWRLEALERQRTRLQNQEVILEDLRWRIALQTDMVELLKHGRSHLNVDIFDGAIDDISQNLEKWKMIQEELSETVGFAEFFKVVQEVLLMEGRRDPFVVEGVEAPELEDVESAETEQDEESGNNEAETYGNFAPELDQRHGAVVGVPSLTDDRDTAPSG